MTFDLKLSRWDRICWWFQRHLSRRQCDGCQERFTLNRVDPVSGDYWLCGKCFYDWYPEFRR